MGFVKDWLNKVTAHYDGDDPFEDAADVKSKKPSGAKTVNDLPQWRHIPAVEILPALPGDVVLDTVGYRLCWSLEGGKIAAQDERSYAKDRRDGDGMTEEQAARHVQKLFEEGKLHFVLVYLDEAGVPKAPVEDAAILEAVSADRERRIKAYEDAALAKKRAEEEAAASGKKESSATTESAAAFYAKTFKKLSTEQKAALSEGLKAAMRQDSSLAFEVLTMEPDDIREFAEAFASDPAPAPSVPADPTPAPKPATPDPTPSAPTEKKEEHPFSKF